LYLSLLFGAIGTHFKLRFFPLGAVSVNKWDLVGILLWHGGGRRGEKLKSKNFKALFKLIGKKNKIKENWKYLFISFQTTDTIIFMIYENNLYIINRYFIL